MKVRFISAECSLFMIYCLNLCINIVHKCLCFFEMRITVFHVVFTTCNDFLISMLYIVFGRHSHCISSPTAVIYLCILLLSCVISSKYFSDKFTGEISALLPKRRYVWLCEHTVEGTVTVLQRSGLARFTSLTEWLIDTRRMP